MTSITATTPYTQLPAWAVLERRLFDLLDAAVDPFLDKYTAADGTLIWRDAATEGYPSRDGADDFYESFGNWPLYYLLGGGDRLLPLSHRQWDAVTRQLTSYGVLTREYELGYDQFHQSESYIYFYALCLADPGNELLRERAERFAGFYLGSDPEAPNYDRERRLIRAPHNGAGGPRWGISDTEPRYGWSPGMARYGLPYHDVPGITTYDDLRDPELARRMGEVMEERMGRGDVAGNLCVTSLITNAFLLTGEERYREWVLEYTDAWLARAEANGGLLPDNIGQSGQVGEYLGGKWYGGLYGWTWPHGYYNIGYAAVDAALNAFLISGERRFLDLPRRQFDTVWEQGRDLPYAELEMSLREFFATQPPDEIEFVVPYRYGDHGWFDFQPMSTRVPAALWNVTEAAEDWNRLLAIRARSTADWRRVLPMRGKEDADHEPAWLAYLCGDNPDYPEAILGQAYAQASRRLDQIRRDDADITTVHIHHWQDANPITTEALVHLTTGSPQIIYNGGLFNCRVRYFDAERRRPGLPADVAALVSSVDRGSLDLHLVNTSGLADRTVILQAGGFGEHRFREAAFRERVSDYPGAIGNGPPPEIHTAPRTVEAGGRYLQVVLPAGTELRLTLAMDRHAGTPGYHTPWD